MAINSSRITLRPFELTDAEDFMLIVGDDKVTHYTRWSTYISKEEALDFIRDVCIPHPWTRSICVENRTIGFVSVSPDSGDERCRAEIGYAIAKKYWGQGICTEVVKIAVSQVFKEYPHLVRIQGFVDAENKGSQRVLEKAGFLREGTLRKYVYVKGVLKDIVVFSLLLEDTLPPK